MAVHDEQSNIGDIKKNSLVLHALVAWAAHRWPRSDKKANAPGGRPNVGGQAEGNLSH